MKPKWYLEDKKIFFTRWEFRLFVIFTFLLIMAKTFIFLVAFFDHNSWVERVNQFKSKYDDTLDWGTAEGMLRIRWVIQFVVIFGIGLTFLMMARFGFGKKKYGYFFSVFWIVTWGIIIAGNILIMRSYMTEAIISSVLMIPLLMTIMMHTYNLRQHRIRLYNKYLTWVKKGGK